MDSNYEFEIIDEFSHYVSSRDKTNLTPSAFVKNSKNMYKKRSGTVANRPGLKVRGQLNAANAGVISSYEWVTSFNITRPIRVTSDGNLSVEYDNNDGNGPIWYNLLTGLTKLHFSFDGSYFDQNQAKQLLIAANGSVLQIYNWEGGIAQLTSSTAPVSGVIAQPFDNNVSGGGFGIAKQGSGYQAGDILTLIGGSGTAQVFVSTVDNSGKITALDIYVVPQGSGYIAGTTYNTTVTNSSGGPSAGTGAQIIVKQVFTAGTVTKSNPSTTFFQDGFSKSPDMSQWKFIANGVEYSYTGGQDSQTLTGVTPDPSAIPPGTIIMSPFIPITGVPFNAEQTAFSLLVDYTCDFIEVINNQLYIGSYNSTAVAASSNTDYRNFQQVTNPPIGSPFLLALDNNGVGISQKNYIPVIFGGTSDIYELNITSQVIPQGTGDGITVQVVGTTKITLAGNEGPINQDFIDTDGLYIVWLGQDRQLHVFGAQKEIFFSDKAPILSQDVYDELQQVDFTNGALRLIDEYTYITAPVQGTHYVYQTREFVDEADQDKSEKIWNPPFVAGISRFANINGVVYGHSYLNPMIYQVWDTDQWHDDDAVGTPGGIPYECILAMAYQQLPGKSKTVRRQGKLVFDKVYIEGYMSRGTPLYGRIYYDYQGASDVQTIYINSPAIPNVPVQPQPVKNVKLYSYLTAPPLATDPLNDNPLGSGITQSTDEQDYLPKFRAIRKVTPVDCFEFGIEFYSYELDARWEILAFGVNMQLSQRIPRELL